MPVCRAPRPQGFRATAVVLQRTGSTEGWEASSCRGYVRALTLVPLLADSPSAESGEWSQALEKSPSH